MSPAPLSDQIAQLKRQHILNAASAGMADGTIYNHFANKDALLFAILEQLSAAEMSEIQVAQNEGLKPEEFLNNYLVNRMQEIDESFTIFKALLPETFVNAELAQTAYDNIYAPGFALCEQYFQQWMEAGEMPPEDPAIAARLFASPMMGLLFLRVLGDRHVTENWAAYTQALIQFMQPHQP